MARRFAERGVRFVQCTHSYKWDQHGNLKKDHARNAAEVDQPIAALLNDLKARGLLEDTLVLWGGEFGRTPVCARQRRARSQPSWVHDVDGWWRDQARYSLWSDRSVWILCC